MALHLPRSMGFLRGGSRGKEIWVPLSDSGNHKSYRTLRGWGRICIFCDSICSKDTDVHITGPRDDSCGFQIHLWKSLETPSWALSSHPAHHPPGTRASEEQTLTLFHFLLEQNPFGLTTGHGKRRREKIFSVILGLSWKCENKQTWVSEVVSTER